MEIRSDWGTIKRTFNDVYRANGFCAIASVNSDGTPHVTPIGSLVLYDDCRGVYAEEFPTNLPRNLKENRRVCVMAVKSGFGFMLKALIKGEFSSSPGIRLTGTVGERRIGTDDEIDRWLRRFKLFRRLKGYDLLWRHMKHVRDIYFDGAEPVRVGRMTRNLIP